MIRTLEFISIVVKKCHKSKATVAHTKYLKRTNTSLEKALIHTLTLTPVFAEIIKSIKLCQFVLRKSDAFNKIQEMIQVTVSLVKVIGLFKWYTHRHKNSIQTYKNLSFSLPSPYKSFSKSSFGISDERVDTLDVIYLNNHKIISSY